MNETFTTLVGNLVADPVTATVAGSRPVTRFRLAVTERTFNPTLGRTVDGRTSFFQVSAWGYLGLNVGESLRKGERVIVYGKLAVEQYTGKEGEPRTSVSVEARAVGHDLTFGGTRFHKQARPDVAAAESAGHPGALPDDARDHEPLAGDDLADGLLADESGEPIPEYREVDGLLVDAAGELAQVR